MSMKRTLLSGLVLAPLCLALPGTAAAAAGPGETLPLTTGWWPNQSSSEEESAVFAGIGGAGVLHHESGVDEWGNRWSEHDGSLAGIGGAAVLHGSRETSGHPGRPLWPAQDAVRTQRSVPVAASPGHAAAPASASTAEPAKAVVPAKAALSSPTKKAAARTAGTAPVRTIREAAPAVADRDAAAGSPARHHREGRGSSYHEEATSAGPEGATSAQVSSHAGRDHAWYSASELAAGPAGATSAGVAALAVPGAAGYRTWDVGAGPTGAYSHSTGAAADVREPDLD
ncbi:hypothetical protein [Amycolatopsis rubida]|uniref:Uncharacterized protein n=1 Tax=Amycolatopsis rubida TaxID=112413 RepID=A0A1I5KCE1_9PSEU|nr:hypothetical protein [Amycolatopsis rubida]SFO82710.1 hypothetical protein SAMN05421854_103129 [Amycolatopsis rubida]